MREEMFKKAGSRLTAGVLAVLFLTVCPWNTGILQAVVQAAPAPMKESVQTAIPETTVKSALTAEPDSGKRRNVLIGERKVPGQKQESEAEETARQYEEFEERLEAVEKRSDIVRNGFAVLEDQVFEIVMESFGEESLTFVPALDTRYHRLALFLADPYGRIVFKTAHLQTNNCIPGKMRQTNRGIAAVSFQDMNDDGLTDIVLITKCKNEGGPLVGKPYKIGDVLFQGEKTFYSDYRLSDRLNRFGMNKSIDIVAAHMKNGVSTEFLYTASTLDELTENGMCIIEEQCYERDFEKLGRLKVVPGTFRIAEYLVFMIYLVDEEGRIVFSLQPMDTYESLYSLKGFACKDVDGDGMKDLVVLARYSYAQTDGTMNVVCDCSIYYQRTDGFEEDRELVRQYRCDEKTKMEDLVRNIREFWGWK